jgi:hypothetical protein
VFQKNLKITDLTPIQKRIAEAVMLAELTCLRNNHPIRSVFSEAWHAYKCGEFTYDGATFVRERNSGSIFEVAALVHDYRNSSGCVGKAADQELFDIMIKLNYPLKLIIDRWLYCRFTFINVFKHRCLKTLCKQLPTNLYKLDNS